MRTTGGSVLTQKGPARTPAPWVVGADQKTDVEQLASVRPWLPRTLAVYEPAQYA